MNIEVISQRSIPSRFVSDALVLKTKGPMASGRCTRISTSSRTSVEAWPRLCFRMALSWTRWPCSWGLRQRTEARGRARANKKSTQNHAFKIEERRKMNDDEIVAALRAESPRLTPVQLADLLQRLTGGRLSQGSIVTSFARAFPSVPLRALLDAGAWRRLSDGGLSDAEFNDLLAKYVGQPQEH
jgi:hypothetical protein